MTMKCRNNERGGSFHTHEDRFEARRCWFPPAAPVVASPPAPLAAPRDAMTDRQAAYIRSLGGTPESWWTKDEASEAIKRLLKNPKEKRVTDPRLKMIEGMIDLIPDGFYAVANAEGGHVDFLKIKRPTSGKYKGSVKVSTQHSERWQERIVKWPSGQWSVYHSPTIQILLGVIADHKTCARRYAIELQACACCGKKLTDDRSRHYLIGPVCDQKTQWEWMIEWVDDQNDGRSYEQLVARGLPTRVWQNNLAA